MTGEEEEEEEEEEGGGGGGRAGGGGVPAWLALALVHGGHWVLAWAADSDSTVPCTGLTSLCLI